MIFASEDYVSREIDKQVKFEHERYWELWHRLEDLEQQHKELLDFLDLEIRENPRTTIVKKGS